MSDKEKIKPLPPKSSYKVICVPEEKYKELQEQLSQELMKNVEKDRDIEKLESKLNKYKNMEFVKRLNRLQEENKVLISDNFILGLNNIRYQTKIVELENKNYKYDWIWEKIDEIFDYNNRI